MVKSYKDLIVWRKSMDFASNVYDSTKSWPKEELYGLTSQIRRSVVSVPSNIAEGHSRNSTAEYRKFVSIAKGSLAEAETQLMLAERFGYISSDELAASLALQVEINKKLTSLLASLAEKVRD